MVQFWINLTKDIRRDKVLLFVVYDWLQVCVLKGDQVIINDKCKQNNTSKRYK